MSRPKLPSKERRVPLWGRVLPSTLAAIRAMPADNDGRKIDNLVQEWILLVKDRSGLPQEKQ